MQPINQSPGGGAWDKGGRVHEQSVGGRVQAGLSVNLCVWTDCIIDKIFKNIKIVKFITTAIKRVVKLVKLQSLVAKCCEV